MYYTEFLLNEYLIFTFAYQPSHKYNFIRKNIYNKK